VIVRRILSEKEVLVTVVGMEAMRPEDVLEGDGKGVCWTSGVAMVVSFFVGRSGRLEGGIQIVQRVSRQFSSSMTR
jgi:hypothetical protein